MISQVKTMSNISLGILLSSEAVFESLILEADRGLSHYFFAFEDGGQTRLTDAETSEFVIYCAQCTEKVQVNVLTEGPRSNCEHVFKALGEDEVTREEWIARTRGGRDLCNNLYANFANPGSNKRDRMLTLACTLCGFSMSFRRSSQELSKHLAGVLLNSSREDTIYSLYALKRYVEGFIEDSGRPVNSENKNFLRVFKDAQTL